jgi:hypothetical protein
MVCIGQALTLDPSHIEANLEAARILIADRTFDKARQCLDLVLRRAPEHQEARELLSKLPPGSG